jgi:hypothetical protein
MDAYNAAMDKIGAAIIDWSDPDGKFRADREVSTPWLSRHDGVIGWCQCISLFASILNNTSLHLVTLLNNYHTTIIIVGLVALRLP